MSNKEAVVAPAAAAAAQLDVVPGPGARINKLSNNVIAFIFSNFNISKNEIFNF
jgi:hypothetical protein